MPERTPTPQRLFTKVANYYDALNKLLSLGQDSSWRAGMLFDLSSRGVKSILDLCCGTGENARVCKKIDSSIYLVGIDQNSEMLRVAKEKDVYNKIILGDVISMNTQTDSFDAVIMSFAYYDLGCDRDKVLKGVADSLKDSGIFASIEFGLPEGIITRRASLFFLNQLAAILNLINIQPLAHLLMEIAETPSYSKFLDEMSVSGFDIIRMETFAFGFVKYTLSRVKRDKNYAKLRYFY